MHFSFPCHGKHSFFLGCGIGLRISGLSSDFHLPIVSFFVRSMLANSLFCSRWCSKPALGNVWNLSQSRQGARFHSSHGLRGHMDVPKSATSTLGNSQQNKNRVSDTHTGQRSFPPGKEMQAEIWRTARNLCKNQCRVVGLLGRRKVPEMVCVRKLCHGQQLMLTFRAVGRSQSLWNGSWAWRL